MRTWSPHVPVSFDPLTAMYTDYNNYKTMITIPTMTFKLQLGLSSWQKNLFPHQFREGRVDVDHWTFINKIKQKLFHVLLNELICKLLASPHTAHSDMSHHAVLCAFIPFVAPLKVYSKPHCPSQQTSPRGVVGIWFVGRWPHLALLELWCSFGTQSIPAYRQGVGKHVITTSLQARRGVKLYRYTVRDGCKNDTVFKPPSIRP